MIDCKWFSLRVKTGKENSVKEFIENKKTEFGITDEIKTYIYLLKKKLILLRGKKKLKKRMNILDIFL